MEGEMTKQNTMGVSIWIFYLTSIIHSDGICPTLIDKSPDDGARGLP